MRLLVTLTMAVLLWITFAGSESIKGSGGVSNIQFTQQEMPAGLQQRSIVVIDENNQAQTIGSINILSGTQLAIFASPVFVEMDKTTLPPDVTALIEIVFTIKNNLQPDLERVALLGDLYIHPEFRGKGYAQALIKNTCQEIFNRAEADLIVLTPTPFEYENNVQKLLKGTLEYESKKERLITLYQRCGFVLYEGQPLFLYLEKKIGY